MNDGPAGAGFEDGYGAAMHNIGRLILDLRQRDASGDAMLGAVLAMVELRMITGLDDAVDGLTGPG